VKYAQWQEAIKNRQGIRVGLANTFQRFRHYHRLLGTDDAAIKLPDYPAWDTVTFEGRRTDIDEPTVTADDPQVTIGGSFRDGGHPISPEEGHELDLLEAAQIGQDLAAVLETTGAFLNLIPDVEASAKPWGLGVGVNFGGTSLGHLFQGLAQAARGIAGRIGHEASMAGRMAGFARREQDWALQRKAAAGELTQLYKQLRAAEIREYLAQREHQNHVTQTDQSRQVLEFLTNEQNLLVGDNRKISTEEFYLWMKREAQSLHAKAFQLAFDVAKRAEKAWHHELGDDARTFVRGGYLAGKEGLFAGDRLHFDLKQMELAYLEQNTREFEITTHISLAEWFPVQLIDFRRDGKCDFALPEALFDLDCPGLSHRRIRSVALSLPCVLGPYTTVNCALTLGESWVRRGTGGYGKDPDTDNFASGSATVSTVITSGGQEASGMFEPNLRDERYLAFEYGGVIGSWSLELLGKPRPFDYDTIADVVLTIRYTALSQGSRPAAETAAQSWLQANAARAFSMRHEFPSEWAAFKAVEITAGGKAALTFTLTTDHFAYRQRDLTDPKRMHLFFGGTATGTIEFWRAGKSLGTTETVSGTTIDSAFPATGDFELRFASNAIDDLWIVVDWSAGPTH